MYDARVLVRELKSSAVRAICPDHFFGRRALPAGSPLFGEVVDAHTYTHECEFCAAELCADPRVRLATAVGGRRQVELAKEKRVAR